MSASSSKTYCSAQIGMHLKNGRWAKSLGRHYPGINFHICCSNHSYNRIILHSILFIFWRALHQIQLHCLFFYIFLQPSSANSLVFWEKDVSNMISEPLSQNFSRANTIVLFALCFLTDIQAWVRERKAVFIYILYKAIKYEYLTCYFRAGRGQIRSNPTYGDVLLGVVISLL